MDHRDTAVDSCATRVGRRSIRSASSTRCCWRERGRRFASPWPEAAWRSSWLSRRRLYSFTAPSRYAGKLASVSSFSVIRASTNLSGYISCFPMSAFRSRPLPSAFLPSISIPETMAPRLCVRQSRRCPPRPLRSGDGGPYEARPRSAPGHFIANRSADESRNGQSEAMLLGFDIAATLDLVLAIPHRRRPFFTWPVVIFVELLRFTPLLVEIFFLYFVLSQQLAYDRLLSISRPSARKSTELVSTGSGRPRSPRVWMSSPLSRILSCRRRSVSSCWRLIISLALSRTRRCFRPLAGNQAGRRAPGRRNLLLHRADNPDGPRFSYQEPRFGRINRGGRSTEENFDDA